MSIETGSLQGTLPPALVWIVPALAAITVPAAGQVTPLEWQLPHYSGEIALAPAASVAEAAAGEEERFDLIVALNRCLPPSEVHDLFAKLGRVAYIGRLLTTVHLEDVPAHRLGELKSLKPVARIDRAVDPIFATDVSARFVQARRSKEYSVTAEDLGLDGRGVQVAVVDTGVDDRRHAAFSGMNVRGFDASDFEDADRDGRDDDGSEPGDVSTNPAPDGEVHGTRVASIALGRPVSAPKGDDPDPNPIPREFTGVAPGAGLVDVKIRTGSDFVEALDWLGRMRQTGELANGVVNLSLAFTTGDDDGSHYAAKLVDELSALGLAVVIGHGNARDLGANPGDRHTAPPGSASTAITVGAVGDRDQIDRRHHLLYKQRLVGPRKDFDPARPDPLTLKPDLTAPGVNIYGAEPRAGFNAYYADYNYFSGSGTSFAAPHVAGAVAILLEERPKMPPASLKELLRQTADSSHNKPYGASVAPLWDPARGAGILDVGEALATLRHAASGGDVRFPSCTVPAGRAGEPCGLAGRPSWDNAADVRTLAIPRRGVANAILADVRYEAAGEAEESVVVSFGVYPLAVGNSSFYHVGSRRISILPGNTVTVTMPWTPPVDGLYCFQVEIGAARDREYGNNVTRRCAQFLSGQPAVLRVENPYGRLARFWFETEADPPEWRCSVAVPGGEGSLSLDPATDCPADLAVTFEPPATLQPQELARCDVQVFAAPFEAATESLVGGAPAFAQRELLGGVTLNRPLN